MEEGGLGGKGKGNRGERKIWQGIENNQTYYSHLKNIRIKPIFLQLINGNTFLKTYFHPTMSYYNINYCASSWHGWLLENLTRSGIIQERRHTCEDALFYVSLWAWLWRVILIAVIAEEGGNIPWGGSCSLWER